MNSYDMMSNKLKKFIISNVELVDSGKFDALLQQAASLFEEDDLFELLDALKASGVDITQAQEAAFLSDFFTQVETYRKDVAASKAEKGILFKDFMNKYIKTHYDIPIQRCLELAYKKNNLVVRKTANNQYTIW